MEAKWSRELPEGRNPDIKFMAHVWEDLRVLPKPLALHLACEVMSMVGHAVLRYMGFRMENCQVRCACSALPVQLTPIPFVVCHTARMDQQLEAVERAECSGWRLACLA